MSLRAYLVDARIAGPVATSREANLASYRRFADGEEHSRFGVSFTRPWDFADVLATMAEKVGVAADPGCLSGPDTIDPDRTVERLDALAAELAQVAERRGRVLFGTGHPAGLLALHVRLATALAAAGCEVLTPAAGSDVPAPDGRRRHIRHVAGVAAVSPGGELLHTHSPRPMSVMLAALAASGAGPPDLVVADHGFAGAAGAAGLRTVGFADSNDPALFAAEAEGVIEVAVPLDDNVLPHLYEPVAAYVTRMITHLPHDVHA